MQTKKDTETTTALAPGQLLSALESVLFIAGRPLEVSDMRKILRIDEDDIRAALEWLAQSYVQERRGLRLQRLGDQVQLVSAPENARYIAELLGMPTHAKLTTAAMETLAVIAYRQPITRAQLEQIRGVNSDRALTTLLQHGLVSEVGRAATVGRPVLFGTTIEFLQQFGLPDLESLPAPDLADVQAEKRAAAGEDIRLRVAASDVSQMSMPVTPDVE